jgi:isoleucyl-tRNA synthetase
MQHVLEAMVHWLAPILSFTAEEIWRHMPGEHAESVFHSTWAALPAGADVQSSVDWPVVLEARAAVLPELERLRVAGAIGAPLDAAVDLYAAPATRTALASLGDELRFVLITSSARVHPAEARPPEAVPVGATGDESMWILARPAQHTKCVRCWHRRADVGSDPSHPELCARCVVNVDGAGETRRFA